MHRRVTTTAAKTFEYQKSRLIPTRNRHRAEHHRQFASMWLIPGGDVSPVGSVWSGRTFLFVRLLLGPPEPPLRPLPGRKSPSSSVLATPANRVEIACIPPIVMQDDQRVAG